MSLIDELNTSYKYVVNNSKFVSINYAKVDEMINRINASNINYWLDSNPFGILDMDIADIIHFLFIYHAIGDYCFWGDPKWEINTPDGKLDGSYAIIYLIRRHLISGKSFDMSFEDFKIFLKGNVEIPLLSDRYENLREMYKVIGSKHDDFFDMIKKMTSDRELLDYIVKNFSYFEDVAKFDGRDIYFYKRAQLLTSDILHVLGTKCGVVTDYSHLIGCADYKIPQVMRCYGMLDFVSSLAEKVDHQLELPENSIEEIEIRANDLEVINYIYEQTGRHYSRMDINDFIWLLGQDKTKMTKPYHRTLTKHY